MPRHARARKTVPRWEFALAARAPAWPRSAQGGLRDFKSEKGRNDLVTGIGPDSLTLGAGGDMERFMLESRIPGTHARHPFEEP